MRGIWGTLLKWLFPSGREMYVPRIRNGGGGGDDGDSNDDNDVAFISLIITAAITPISVCLRFSLALLRCSC
jgi:hypothetical protein